jgi:gluconolactonase
MNAPTDSPRAVYETLAGKYKGKRFNSPNDLVYNQKGELYFTDPPYGLVQKEKDPKREIDFQGVYLLRKNGEVVLWSPRISNDRMGLLFPLMKKLCMWRILMVRARFGCLMN